MSNRPDRSRWAIPWLLLGGFILGIGWFVGLVKLWDSRAWTVGEKLLGTLVVPFGLAGSLWFAQTLVGSTSERTCALPHAARCVVVTRTITSPSALDVVGAIVLIIAPIAVAYYLFRRRGDHVVMGPSLA